MTFLDQSLSGSLVEGCAPSELALAFVHIVVVIAACVRLARVATGRKLPTRWVAAARTLALVSTFDARRPLAVRSAVGAALGWGGALPFLARISVAWGGILSCTDAGTGHVPGEFAGSTKAEFLAWSLGLGLRHVAFGFVLGLGGTMAYAGLLALARRLTTKHLGVGHFELGSRWDAHDVAILSVSSWHVASFVGPVLIATAAAFPSVVFHPTSAMNVSVGRCAAHGVWLRLTADGRVQRLDSELRVLASAPRDRLRWLRLGTTEHVQLQVDDGVSHRVVISVLDGLRADARRSVCMPVFAEAVGPSPTDAPR